MNPHTNWSRRAGLAGASAALLALTLSGCGGDSEQPQQPSQPGGPPRAAPAAPTVPPLGPGCPKPGTVTVHNAQELKSALTGAKPGAVIELAAGTYSGGFAAEASGSKGQPIVLCGQRDAVLDGSGANYTLHLENASYWEVVGFTIRGGQKGLMVDQGQHNLIDSLEIEQVEQEALHLRKNSSNNVVRGNTIHNTGLKDSKFGEGVYIGTAEKNWPRYSNGQPDRSDRNLIEANTISDTTSEAVDIKEGTTGGIVRGNTFTGPSSDAESWVNVKGNGWQILGNTGRGSSQDGFSVHQILDGWGVDNVFDGNTAVVDGPGYGINVTKNKDRNRVTCSNKAESAGKGLTNIDCS